MGLIVLFDGGKLKHSAKNVACNRLNIPRPVDDNPENNRYVKLIEHPGTYNTMYDILRIELRSKLGGIEKAFGQISMAAICKDIGNSWRADITATMTPDAVTSSGDYKGHRRSDEIAIIRANVAVNRMFDDAVKTLSEIGDISLLGYDRIEADDFMIIAARKYFAEGHNVIIVSEDGDIPQVVTSNPETKNYIMLMQPKSNGTHFVIDHGLRAMSETTSIFEMSPFSQAVTTIIQNAIIIAPQYMLLEKLLNGDGGDGITPIMVRVAPNKSGKMINHKLHRKDFDQIFAYFSEKNPEGYFKMENMYDEQDIRAILEFQHRLVFKHELDTIDPVWQKFYYQKFIENRQAIIVNKQELGEWHTLTESIIAKECFMISPKYSFPDAHTLKAVNSIV